MTRRVRTLVLSGVYGVAAAIVISGIGPLWGGLLLILSFPLTFRTEERVALAALFLGFSIAWPLLLALGAPIFFDRGSLPVVFVSGFVPVVLAAATVLLIRVRKPRGGVRSDFVR
jgi:hypothetical protein